MKDTSREGLHDVLAKVRERRDAANATAERLATAEAVALLAYPLTYTTKGLTFEVEVLPQVVRVTFKRNVTHEIRLTGTSGTAFREGVRRSLLLFLDAEEEGGEE